MHAFGERLYGNHFFTFQYTILNLYTACNNSQGEVIPHIA